MLMMITKDEQGRQQHGSKAIRVIREIIILFEEFPSLNPIG
jgi:hypothetical protein